MRVVIAATHPIQYQAPLFRKLAARTDLTVVFLMHQTPEGQASSGFGVKFEWDTPLLEGYRHVFANNVSRQVSADTRDGIRLSGHEALLSTLNPDALMVMGWFPNGYLQVIRWAERRRVPLVCRGESNLISRRSFPKRMAKFVYFRWLFRKFRTFAVIGRHNRELYRRYGVAERKLHWAPYSVDTDFFTEQFLQHRPKSRKPGPWRLGFAGKLIEKKRPRDLFAAAARCHVRREIQLVVIGDGPMRPDLERQANELSVAVDFRGFLNQSSIVPRGYADIDALVLASGENETWGLVVNEAMTGGIPAIVSDSVGCAPDLIAEDTTGYVFRAGDVAGLGACLDRCVRRLQEGHDFSAAVLARIAEYSVDRTADGIHAAFTAALANV